MIGSRKKECKQEKKKKKKKVGQQTKKNYKSEKNFASKIQMGKEKKDRSRLSRLANASPMAAVRPGGAPKPATDASAPAAANAAAASGGAGEQNTSGGVPVLAKLVSADADERVVGCAVVSDLITDVANVIPLLASGADKLIGNLLVDQSASVRYLGSLFQLFSSSGIRTFFFSHLNLLLYETTHSKK
jgi:hypothetical protein